MKNIGFLLYMIFAIQSSGLGIDNNHLQLEGLVIDSETENVLPFAQITCGQTGTVTNNDGYFILKIPGNSSHSRIRISYMGYHSKYLNIDEILDQKNPIRLVRSVHQINEESIRPPESYILDLNNHRQINFEYEDLLMLTFYKETIRADDQMCYLAEGVLKIYLPTIYSSKMPKIQSLKSRKKILVTLDSIKAPIISGHARDMLEGTMRRKQSFLDVKQIKNYKYEYEGVSRFQEKDVVKISFKPLNEKGTSNGILYIDEESSALVKTVYYPEVSNQKFWTNVRWEEEYTEIDGSWYLKYVSYSGTWEVNTIQYNYNAILLVTEFEIVESAPEMTDVLDDDAVFIDEASDSSDLFWENYNYLKLTNKEKGP